MRLLLINPKCPESFWTFRWAVTAVLPGKRAVNPPLGLATLAALCPPHWEVTIVDENVEPLDLEPQADLIGIGGMGVQFPRQRELLEYYRSRGHFVAAGGSYASLCPEQYEHLADSVICGEAEQIWPQFCADFEAGRALALYRETGTVDLHTSPTPRFDLLKLPLYTTATVQFSRGCPFMCEFCDIIVMFGRKPRHKSLEQIGRELDVLREQGVRKVFFVDDNLIGNIKVAKTLLRFLVDYQERHRYSFSFGTEASLNLAQDEELMDLFRAAHFRWAFIGIESPDEASLRETRKLQNVRQDPLAAVQSLHSHGIEVLAGFIVGFDNDTVTTFERQYEFIVRSGIQTAMIGLLNAMPRTPLHERLRAAGRLREEDSGGDNTKLDTNVVPLGMSREQLIGGYRRLHERLLEDGALARRIINKNRSLGRTPGGMEYGTAVSLSILARLLWRGILRGGPARPLHFLRSMPWRRPWQIASTVSDWIVGLSMQDYARRHLADVAPASPAVWNTRLTRLAQALRRCGTGKVIVGPGARGLGTPVLALSLRAVPGRRLRRTARHLRTFLESTPARLTLRFEEVCAADVPQLSRLLGRLTRFADKISIEAATLQGLMPLDAWPFQLTLPAPAA
ncbi:MAG TPA: radical SAM protein [Steroidobacteraceae bacterium]|nr:radical SAM protein [Steroidobacteraceae bacterium]